MWQSVAQLNFRKLSNNREADIIVLFGRAYHNDPYRFDGRGGTLAHGFYPGTNTGNLLGFRLKNSQDLGFNICVSYTSRSGW